MLKVWHTYRLPILVWIFCGVAFVIGLSILSPVYINKCKSAGAGQPDECKPYHAIIFAIDKALEILSHAETWTALGTLAIAAFTFTLWRSTKNLWAVTKQSADAFASAERPHLLVSQLNAGINNTWMPGEDDPIELPVLYSFEIRNFGRSPAFITGTVFQFHCGELPPAPVYETLRPDKNIVVPGHSFRSGTQQVIGGIPFADQKRVRYDEIALYIYGIVEYKSIFEGRIHKLQFCYRLAFGQSVNSGAFFPDGPDSYWEYA